MPPFALFTANIRGVIFNAAIVNVVSFFNVTRQVSLGLSASRVKPLPPHATRHFRAIVLRRTINGNQELRPTTQLGVPCESRLQGT